MADILRQASSSMIDYFLNMQVLDLTYVWNIISNTCSTYPVNFVWFLDEHMTSRFLDGFLTFGTQSILAYFVEHPQPTSFWLRVEAFLLLGVFQTKSTRFQQGLPDD